MTDLQEKVMSRVFRETKKDVMAEYKRLPKDHPINVQRDADIETIKKIALRAVALYAKYEVRATERDILMDLMAVHFHTQKLRLDDLYEASDFNLLHDVSGINRHFNRETYELTDCFSPRFSAASYSEGAP